MDVLIKWEDGTENVVSTEDLLLTDGSKHFQKNKKVKMNYSGITYFGTILATEYDDDNDNSVDSPDTPNSDVQSNGSDEIPLIELQSKNNSDQLKSPSRQLMKRKATKKKYTQSTNESDESIYTADDSDKDPDFVVYDCAAKKCQKSAVNKCDALLCKEMVCDKHDLCRHHSKLLSLVTKGSEKNKKTTKKRKRSPKNTQTSITETDADRDNNPRSCEHPNCSSEIFSSCNCLKILLCFEHFEADNNCRFHEDVNPEVLFPVEGSPREVPLRRVKRINTYKLAKEQKNKGQCYVRPKTMNVMPPKMLGPRCKGETCSNRGKKCTLFNDEQRSNIMKDFYSMGSLQLQREYLTRYIKTEDTKQKTTNKDIPTRTKSNYYFLPLNGEELPVCKSFFINTLATSDKTIRTTLQKKGSTGTIEKERRGGRYAKQVEQDLALIDGITDHINKFSRVESHYCRKTSTREYLHENLNLMKMYVMYQADTTGNPMKGGYTLYRKVFKSMNLSFHRPKKDQCSLCMSYKNGDEECKQKLKSEYESHITRKEKVRQMKEESKKKAQETNSKVGCAVFDLQQVFSLPITKESAVFYKRRLSVYNFTVYDIASSDCDCYLWHEAISKRGSSEIATCVYSSIKKFEMQNKTVIHLYCDGCAGQNKNSILPTMMLHCINNSSTLEEIRLTFFEPYHGQSEGDSAHSAIGTAVKGAGDIFIPSQLVSIIRLARRKHPYNVKEMTSDDFLAFKELSIKLRVLSIRECDDSEDTVDWTKMAELRVVKSKPDTIQFKSDLNSETYNSISLKRQNRSENPLAREVPKLNKGANKLPKLKYRDLCSLCVGDKSVIRSEDHRQFYKSLPHDEV